MDSISELWGEHSKAIAGAFLVVAVLLTGFVATTLNSGGLGMQSQSGDAYRGGQTTTASNDLDVSADIPGPREEGTTSSTERKRIERIDMDFEAPDAETAIDDSKNLASEHGGYSESEDINKRFGDSGSVTVRVPAENVTAFLEELESQGSWKLKSKNKNVQDVTDRYEELELELKNKRQELNRLEDLINQTDEVDSLIKIQERMSELRSRIQYLENQLQDIDSQVDYTRIDLRFEEPEPITAEFEIRESVTQGYKGIFQSLNFMIVGAGYLLPFAIIFFIYRKIKAFRNTDKE